MTTYETQIADPLHTFEIVVRLSDGGKLTLIERFAHWEEADDFGSTYALEVTGQHAEEIEVCICF